MNWSRDRGSVDAGKVFGIYGHYQFLIFPFGFGALVGVMERCLTSLLPGYIKDTDWGRTISSSSVLSQNVLPLAECSTQWVLVVVLPVLLIAWVHSRCATSWVQAAFSSLSLACSVRQSRVRVACRTQTSNLTPSSPTFWVRPISPVCRGGHESRERHFIITQSRKCLWRCMRRARKKRITLKY